MCPANSLTLASMAGEEAQVGGEVEQAGADFGWAEARSALAWWLDAGVDVALQEEPRNWLLSPAKNKTKSEPVAPTNVAPPSHETLVEIRQWLATSVELPLASATARRVLPHGPEEAAVMLLSDAPTIEDYAADQPIGGAAWELATRMLSAIGIAADQTYSASLSCFNAPGTRISEADRERCAEIARDHVRLARPKRLLLLGDLPAQALLGKPLVQARGHVHRIEGVRAIATFHPRHLIKRPLDKSLAWKDLLLLMEEDQ